MAVSLASHQGSLSTSAVTTALEILGSSVGLLIGVAAAIWLAVDRLSVGVFALTTVIGLGAMTALSVEGRSLAVGLAGGLIAPALWWTRRPRAERRALLLVDRRWRRQILVREVFAPRLWWLGTIAAIGVLVVMSTADGPWSWIALLALAGSVVALIAPKTSEAASTAPDVQGEVALITVDDPDRIADVGSTIASSAASVSVAPWPPVAFRGLVGWNLGLGLDPEAAAWAGQLAARMRLDQVLADPEVVLDVEQAFVLSVCRAMAMTSEAVVIEFDAASMSPSTLRDVASIVRQTRAGRQIAVVCNGAEAGRRFVGRVRSTT